MVAPRFLPASLSLLASGLVAAFAGTAQAGQSCALNSDCGHGFACKVVAESSCPGFACPEGQPCPEPPPCNPTQIRECAPASCNAHSDCADGMVCYESGSVTTCPETTTPTPACPPNADCFVPPTPPKPPSASECTTVTMRACTPRYQLPCANEASCGAGFNCVPDPEECGCSGSSGRPAAGTGSSGSSSGSAGAAGVGGAPNTGTPTPQNGSGAPLPPSDPVEPPGGFAPPPNPVPPPDCSCTTPTTKHCEPKAVSCNADTDCPTTWKCETIGGGTSGGCAGGGRVLPDGGIEIITPVCDPAPPTTTVKQCMPPYYYGGGNKGGLDTPATGGGTTGNGTAGTGSIPPRGTGQIDPGSPPTNPQPTTGGEVGNNADPGDTDTSHGAAADNSSCQMSVGHASTTGGSLLALLGIAGMARRRRTRWG